MKNNTLIQNELEANIFAAKVLRITIVVLLIVLALKVAGIFVTPMNTMLAAIGISVFLSALPTVFINILKKNDNTMKYLIIGASLIMVTVLNTLLTYHTVLMFLFPIALSSLYFSKRLSIATTGFTVISIAASMLLSLQITGVADQNFMDFKTIIIHGIIPRSLVLFAISSIFIALASRTNILLSSMMSAEKTEEMLKNTLELKEISKNTSLDINNAIKSLFDFTETTHSEANNMAQKTDNLVAQTQNAFAQLSDNSFKLAGVSSALNDSSGKLSEATNKTNKVVADVKESMNIIENADSSMDSIFESTKASVEYMTELEKDSKKIDEVVNLIKNMAEQINLLALNASIEAARAGEAGRGFTVVADEVRKLAEDSKHSTESISNLVASMMKNTSEASKWLESSHQSVLEGRKNFKNIKSTFNITTANLEDLSRDILYSNTAIRSCSTDSMELSESLNTTVNSNEKSLGHIESIANSISTQLNCIESIQDYVQNIGSQMDSLVKVVDR